MPRLYRRFGPASLYPGEYAQRLQPLDSPLNPKYDSAARSANKPLRFSASLVRELRGQGTAFIGFTPHQLCSVSPRRSDHARKLLGADDAAWDCRERYCCIWPLFGEATETARHITGSFVRGTTPLQDASGAPNRHPASCHTRIEQRNNSQGLEMWVELLSVQRLSPPPP
jgi:hypothetical protein